MKLSDKRIDPSEIKQQFDDLQISIHCCRYWKFSSWNFSNLSAPFWRFYYNMLPGAVISFGDQQIEPGQSFCVLIPPNTPFSISTLYDQNPGSENIQGSRMTPDDHPEQLRARKQFDHLFIHFNLGLKYDGFASGIYTISLSPEMDDDLQAIKADLISDFQHVHYRLLIRIYSVISRALSLIPADRWPINSYDFRIMTILNFIDLNLTNQLTNVDLARRVNLATNSFARLFRENTGCSVQQYILKRRIEKALHLLHHTQSKIERIAYDCGFYDLHHFSRVFKKQMQVSPSAYKKQKTMD